LGNGGAGRWGQDTSQVGEKQFVLFGFFEEEIERVEYFLESEVNIASHIAVSDWVFDFDKVILRSVADELSDVLELCFY